MPITSYHNSHYETVLSLRDETFASLNLSRFVWQPCQQVESLRQDCTKFVFHDGQVKAYAAAYKLDITHFRLNLIVDPEHTRRGIGSILLSRVEDEVVRMGGKFLQARLLDDVPRTVEFPLARGFIKIHTMLGMSLQAEDYSFDRWEGLGKTLYAKGFHVTTLKDALRADQNAMDKLARLYGLAREGWPTPDPSWRLDSTEESRRTPFKSIKHPERFFIMEYEDDYVGFTSARNLGAGTGVHPGYRNIGIATYLKAHDINRCIEDGQKYFESATASESMQRVNEKLGYRFNELSEVRFVKELS